MFIWLCFYHRIAGWVANGVEPDQTVTVCSDSIPCNQEILSQYKDVIVKAYLTQVRLDMSFKLCPLNEMSSLKLWLKCKKKKMSPNCYLLISPVEHLSLKWSKISHFHKFSLNSWKLIKTSKKKTKNKNSTQVSLYTNNVPSSEKKNEENEKSQKI